MEFSVSRKGAAIVSLWAFTLLAVLLRAFWVPTAGEAVIALCALGLLCFGLLAARLSSCRVRCGAHHLTVRRGLIFTSTQRLPLRFISGCYLFRSALQRLTGTCVLLLLTSGGLVLVFGAPLADADRLCRLLTYPTDGGAHV